MKLRNQLLFGALSAWLGLGALAQVPPPITFDKAFEGGSLGKIETLADARFRCAIEGQHDERGRNRQATWYFFRMNHVQGRDITLTLTDAVGEYNDRPGACPLSADIVPVFSYDGEHWESFAATEWDDAKKEATLKFKPVRDAIWIAHIAPYPHTRLLRLLSEVDNSPHARLEIIGKTALGRDLHLVTVTDFEKSDTDKKTVWLQARQHAWEAGTSFVLEGALRFIISDDPRVRAWRAQTIFKFTPMIDPDGCALGKVRFNAHGYDVNRHWDVVDLRDKQQLHFMPEIWYVKKTLFGWLDAGHAIDLMVNLHNTESSEFLDTQCDDEKILQRMNQFLERLSEKSTFDPSRKLGLKGTAANDTNSLWRERKIPVLLMEQRIGFSQKLGRRPTVEDRLNFGRELISVMAETAR